MKASEKLSETFCKMKFDNISSCHFPIEVRDGKVKCPLDLNDFAINEMISEVLELNNIISSSNIDINLHGSKFIEKYGYIPVLTNNAYQRVFSRATLSCGGRFYKHWIQQVPSEFRKFVLIDGDYTCELDYSSMQPRMIYHKENCDYRDDVYDINCERELAKLALNTMINASSEEQAVKAIMNGWNKTV